MKNILNIHNKRTKQPKTIDHFARCKQHWSRSTSCFSFLTLDKIQPTEHIKLNQKVKFKFIYKALNKTTELT